MTKVYAVVLVAGIVCAGCSKPTAQEYFANANAAEKQAAAARDTMTNPEEAHRLFQPAIQALESLIAEYPSDILADSALFRLAIIRTNDTREPQLAVDTYKKYVGRYPDNPKTPLAMFLIGYLYNNELHNLDSASAAYRRYLAKYPNDQYAQSAQFELNTLGKPLEEILPKSEQPAKPAPKKASRKKAV
jgi:TolA-binding protein